MTNTEAVHLWTGEWGKQHVINTEEWTNEASLNTYDYKQLIWRKQAWHNPGCICSHAQMKFTEKSKFYKQKQMPRCWRIQVDAGIHWKSSQQKFEGGLELFQSGGIVPQISNQVKVI